MDLRLALPLRTPTKLSLMALPFFEVSFFTQEREHKKPGACWLSGSKIEIIIIRINSTFDLLLTQSPSDPVNPCPSAGTKTQSQ